MSTHAEELAAVLRGLKERSGRSYGQLAGRLHLSTSTLHRYCNGAAVPADYAPVERLARLCGATPEELLALHRLWLFADAARRDPGAASGTHPAPAAPPSTPATGPPAGPAPGGQGPAVSTSSGPAPAGGHPAGPPPEAPAPSASTSSAGGRAPGVTPAAGAHRPTPAASGAGTVDPDEGGSRSPAAEPEIGTSAPEATGRRSRRTALVLGAVAAMAAVAVLPAALQGRNDSGGGRANGAPHASTPPGASAPSPAARRHATAAPASAGAASAPEPSSPAAATASTSPAPAAGDRNASAPFHVDVLADNWDTPCGQWFLLARPPGQVPPPPSLDRTGAWASALGGVPAGHLRLQLTAQTGRSEPVVLHALYVHVVSSKPARKGNVYTPGSGCGGGLEPASFAVDLDVPTPRTTPVPGYEGTATTTSLSTFPYRISATDPQVIDVDAATARHDVIWYLELAWSSGPRSGTATVDDHGRPFRTTALQGAPAYYYDGTSWAPATAPD